MRVTDKANLIGILEGILYVYGEPISIGKLAEITSCSDQEIEDALTLLGENLEQTDRGIRLKCYEGLYRLETIPEIAPYLEKLMESTPRPLSQSAMEVLSIIAYKQPVTRQTIDEIRGVRSQATMETLLSHGLIEEKGRLDRIGRPILFGTTTRFLQAFGLSSIDSLPELKMRETEDADQ